jgi:hypothetical protein
MTQSIKSLSYKSIFACLLVFLSLQTLGQEKDFQIWTSLELTAKINKKLSVSFEEEARFNNNASQIKKHFSQPSIALKLNKRITAGVAYRRIYHYNSERTLSNRNYFITQIIYSNKNKRLRYRTRTRYVAKYSTFKKEKAILIPSKYLRQKFDLKYYIRKSPFAPFASFEIYIPLNNPYGNYPDTYQTEIGTDYQINKKQSLSISFMNDLEINVESSLNAFVLCFGYEYNF